MRGRRAVLRIEMGEAGGGAARAILASVTQ